MLGSTLFEMIFRSPIHIEIHAEKIDAPDAEDEQDPKSHHHHGTILVAFFVIAPIETVLPKVLLRFEYIIALEVYNVGAISCRQFSKLPSVTIENLTFRNSGYEMGEYYPDYFNSLPCALQH